MIYTPNYQALKIIMATTFNCMWFKWKLNVSQVCGPRPDPRGELHVPCPSSQRVWPQWGVSGVLFHHCGASPRWEQHHVHNELLNQCNIIKPVGCIENVGSIWKTHECIGKYSMYLKTRGDKTTTVSETSSKFMLISLFCPGKGVEYGMYEIVV